MFRVASKAAILVSLAVINFGCDSGSHSEAASKPPEMDPGALAREAGAGVEVVGRTVTGTRGRQFCSLKRSTTHARGKFSTRLPSCVCTKGTR